MAENMKNLRRLIAQFSETESFPEEIIFKTRAHLVVIKNLDPEINKNHPILIQETIWCLANICLCKEEKLNELMEYGIIRQVRPYLKLMNKKIIESAFWMLSNMLGESIQTRRYVVSCGYLNFIMAYFHCFRASQELSVLLAWFASNFFKSKPAVEDNIAQPFLKTLVPLLENENDSEIIDELVWMFYYYLDTENPNTEFIYNLGILPRLKELFLTNNDSFVLPITRIFCKFSLCDSSFIERFLDCDFKHSLLEKIQSCQPHLQIDSLWLLYNIILTGNKEMEFFNEPNIFNLIRDIIFDNKSNIEIKIQTLKVMKGFFDQYGVSQKEQFILQGGFIDCIFHVMEMMDKRTLQVGLDYIEEVLRTGLKLESSK